MSRYEQEENLLLPHPPKKQHVGPSFFCCANEKISDTKNPCFNVPGS